MKKPLWILVVVIGIAINAAGLIAATWSLRTLSDASQVSALLEERELLSAPLLQLLRGSAILNLACWIGVCLLLKSYKRADATNSANP